MKKIIFTIAFIASGLMASAQVGVGTTDPKVSLQVDKSAVATDADGVLVPRVTVAELNAKDTTYGADQNGTLVFVTAISGAVNETSNVTATGFYYYDALTDKWVGVVSAAPFRLNLGQSASTTYNWANNANFDFYEFTSGAQLTMPAPNDPLFVGRKISLRNGSAGTIAFSGVNGIGTPKGIASWTVTSALEVYSDGTTWYITAGRN